jgi:hypothetical protein
LRDRINAPNFTRCGLSRRGFLVNVLNDLDHSRHALSKRLGNGSLIQIVEFTFSNDSRPR